MKRFPTFNEVTTIKTNDLEFINFMRRDSRKEILESILNSGYYGNDDGYTNFLIETVLNNNLHNSLFEGTLTNGQMYPILLERYINEAKIKDWFMDKKKQVAGWIESGAERAKEKGVQIINKLKSFGDVVKLIVDSVAGFLKAAWDYIKDEVTDGLSEFKDELTEKWKSWSKKDSEGVTDEVKHFSKMSTSTVKWATTGFPKSASGAIQSVGNEDSGTADKEENTEAQKENYNYVDILEQSLFIAFSELIKEDSRILDEATQYINESEHGAATGGLEIPFIGKIIHKLSHVKPFEYLTNIEHWVGEKTNNMFHKISVWVNKYAAGPEPFSYNYLGQCAGFTAGAKIKGALTDIVKSIGTAAAGVAIAATVPGISWILTVLKAIASGIWYVEVGQLGISAATQTVAKVAGSKKEDDTEAEKEPDKEESKA